MVEKFWKLHRNSKVLLVLGLIVAGIGFAILCISLFDLYDRLEVPEDEKWIIPVLGSGILLGGGLLVGLGVYSEKSLVTQSGKRRDYLEQIIRNAAFEMSTKGFLEARLKGWQSLLIAVFLVLPLYVLICWVIQEEYFSRHPSAWFQPVAACSGFGLVLFCLRIFSGRYRRLTGSDFEKKDYFSSGKVDLSALKRMELKKDEIVHNGLVISHVFTLEMKDAFHGKLKHIAWLRLDTPVATERTLPEDLAIMAYLISTYGNSVAPPVTLDLFFEI